MPEPKTTIIPQAAADRSVVWIEAVEAALDAHGDPELSARVMRAAGRQCARQILGDCAEILGKPVETVDELLHAGNQRRMQRHGMANLWERDGNRAHLKIDECACTLVRAGLAQPNPTHCLCSKGLMQELFEALCKGPVTVDMVKAVGHGDDVCEFIVTFEE